MNEAIPSTLRHGRRAAIEPVLDRDERDRVRQAGEDRVVIVALGAEQNGFAGLGPPVGEGDELGGKRRAAIDLHAVRASPRELGGVGVNESDGHAGGAEEVTDGTADAAGADDGECVHALLRGRLRLAGLLSRKRRVRHFPNSLRRRARCARPPCGRPGWRCGPSTCRWPNRERARLTREFLRCNSTTAFSAVCTSS